MLGVYYFTETSSSHRAFTECTEGLRVSPSYYRTHRAPLGFHRAIYILVWYTCIGRECLLLTVLLLPKPIMMHIQNWLDLYYLSYIQRGCRLILTIIVDDNIHIWSGYQPIAKYLDKSSLSGYFQDML